MLSPPADIPASACQTRTMRMSITGTVQRIALAVDLVLVIVFAVIGRANHDEGVTLSGVAHTAWPFLVGVGVGTLVVVALKKPALGLEAGAIVWACTLVLGMLLRKLTGDGIALPFVIVAAIVLAIFLIGSRFVVRRFAHRRITG